MREVTPGYILYRNIKKTSDGGALNKIMCSTYRHVGVVMEVKERSLKGVMVFNYSYHSDMYMLMVETMEDFLGDNQQFKYEAMTMDSQLLKDRAQLMMDYYEPTQLYSITENCEDFLHELVMGNKHSPQREITFFAAITAVLVIGLISSSKY